MSTELATTGPDRSLEVFERSLAAEQEVERRLMRSIVKGVVICIPVFVAIFIGMLAVAVNDHTEWYVWVLVGTTMGLIGSVLFGMLGAVTIAAPTLDEVDKQSWVDTEA
jgi:hypothetical protein